MAFKVGDTVEFKSGGPAMTVVRASGPDDVTCMWYAEAAGEYRTHSFPESLLDEVEFEEEKAD